MDYNDYSNMEINLNVITSQRGFEDDSTQTIFNMFLKYILEK